MQTGAITSLETDKAFFERHEPGRAKATRSRSSRARTIGSIASGCSRSSASPASARRTPKSVTYDPAEDKTFPAGMGISEQPRAAVDRERATRSIFGIAHADEGAAAGGRGGGAGATAAAAAADGAGGRGAGAAAGDDEHQRTAESRHLALQGSAAPVAAGSAGGRRSRVQLRDDRTASARTS